MPNKESSSLKKETVADNDSSDSTKNSTEGTIDDSKVEVQWKDILPYFNAPVAFVLAAITESLGLNYFISVWVSFAVMPFIDSLLPPDDKNISKEA
jgi:hypothetical protein